MNPFGRLREGKKYEKNSMALNYTLYILMNGMVTHKQHTWDCMCCTVGKCLILRTTAFVDEESFPLLCCMFLGN